MGCEVKQLRRLCGIAIGNSSRWTVSAKDWVHLQQQQQYPLTSEAAAASADLGSTSRPRAGHSFTSVTTTSTSTASTLFVFFFCLLAKRVHGHGQRQQRLRLQQLRVQRTVFVLLTTCPLLLLWSMTDDVSINTPTTTTTHWPAIGLTVDWG